MLRMNHTAYTSKDLVNLWRRQKALPYEIERIRDSLGEHTAELTRMQLKLEAFNQQETAPYQKKIDELRARIDALTLPAKIAKMEEDIAINAKRLAIANQKKLALTNELNPVIEKITKLELSEKSIEGHAEILRMQAGLQVLVQEVANRKSEYEILKDKHGEALESERTLKVSLEKLSLEQQDVPLSTDQQSMLAAESSKAEAQVQEIDAAMQGLDEEIKRKESEARQLTFKMHELGSRLDGYARKLVGFKFTDNLPALRELIRQEKVKKNSLDKQLNAAEQDHAQFSAQVETLNHERSAASVRLEQARPMSLPHRDKFNISELEKQIARIEKQMLALGGSRDDLERDIEKQKQLIKADEDEIARKNAQLKTIDNDKFAKDMREKPADKVAELRSRLKTALDQYEIDHPGSADVTVRSCLLSLEKKCNFILQQAAQGISLPELYRRQYCQISGLLWEACRTTRKNNEDFALMLEGVLGKDVIQDDDAIAAYNKLKNANKAELRDYNEVDIRLHDEGGFAQASQEFNTALKNISEKASRAEKKYYAKGEVLLASIIAQKEGTKKRSHFDVKLHADILRVATQMLRTPDDIDLCERLHELSQHKLDGRYSLAKNIIGAIAAFIGGALLLVGGVALGGAIPLSWPIAAGMVAGGAALFAGGIALCVNGRKKGTTKAMDDFEEARLNVTKSRMHSFVNFFGGSTTNASKTQDIREEAASLVSDISRPAKV